MIKDQENTVTSVRNFVKVFGLMLSEDFMAGFDFVLSNKGASNEHTN